MFSIAAGSIVGRDHLLSSELLIGKNNQDAYAWATSSEGPIVGVVCDGSGSAPDSEVGAKLAARLLTDRLLHTTCLPRARDDLLAHLRVLAHAMSGSFTENVNRYFLFTILGFIITPDETFIFSAGDGLFSVNGETRQIDPEEGNRPRYLAYRMLQMEDPGLESVDLEVVYRLPTAEVESLLIGTDGLSDFIAKEHTPLPGSTERLGPLSQFWEEERFFRNRDAIRRRLSLANSQKVTIEEGQRVLHPGLLGDDTTLIVARRETL